MKSKHELIYEKTLKTINELFSDTSVSKSQTKESLETLINEIETMVETLEE